MSVTMVPPRFPSFAAPMTLGVAAVLLWLLATPPLPAAGDDPKAAAAASLIPKPLAAGRYQALAARSPFSPPSAPVIAPPPAPTPPPPGWAEKWILASAAQIGTGYRVTLAPKLGGAGGNTSPAERLIIVTGEDNAERISLSQVQWSEQAGQTRVTLIKDGVPGVFTFEPGALAGSAATAPNNAGRSMNPLPGGGLPAPPSFPQGPSNRPVINPVPQPVPPGGQFQRPTLPPGIVQPATGRAPIRAAPPPPPPIAPRVVTPGVRSTLPGNNAGSDDDDE